MRPAGGTPPGARKRVVITAKGVRSMTVRAELKEASESAREELSPKFQTRF
jgi:hypothetical protein